MGDELFCLLMLTAPERLFSIPASSRFRPPPFAGVNPVMRTFGGLPRRITSACSVLHGGVTTPVSPAGTRLGLLNESG
jgi:hypothetical protein